MNARQLRELSDLELIDHAMAAGQRWFKDASAELQRRGKVDPRAADVLIAAYRSGEVPAWFVAHMLGAVRVPRGYDVAREILLAAPGRLAESYAGPAMARIAGVASYDDLLGLMMEAPRKVSREGAAYGLVELARPEAASAVLEAARAERIRRSTAAHVVGALPETRILIIKWLGSDDETTEAVALGAASTLLACTDGPPDTALAWAIRRTLGARRVKLAPRSREALMKRIAEVTR